MAASLLVLLGLVLVLLGALAFLFAAFRESVLWGLGVLFIPPLSWVFLIVHWGKAKPAFFLQLYGFGFVFAGALISQNGLPWPIG